MMTAAEDVSLPSLTFQLELFPETSGTIALFEDVMNVTDLKAMLINKELDAVMLSPKMLVSPFQIMVAVNKALHVHATGHAITRTVNSEIIYSLSPSTNISESFKVFAMGSTDTSVVVIVLDDPDQTKLKSIAAKIEGVCVPLAQLSTHTDEIMIKKKYSISKAELSVGSLEDAVICKMASSDLS
eukprot:XP_782762.2 PREDICTED: EKC/KEOPS complex subunit Tprkb [Strongylocentrotus purpuratus]